jgi:hypothetical protein
LTNEAALVRPAEYNLDSRSQSRTADGPALREPDRSRVARRAGVDKPIGPHSFTAAFDAGVPLRGVQEATMRYDRARVSLDRHATYIVAADLAGGAR